MAVINLNGGTTTLPAFPTLHGTNATAILNFDGGVLQNSAASTTYINGLTNAFIKAGGATFNTGNGDIIVAQNLITDPVSTGGGMTKATANALNLNGVNTFTGATTITGGTLIIGSAGQLGSGTYSNNIINDGTFVYGSSAAQTLSGVISRTGALTKSGIGTLTLTNTNTYAGATSFNQGTLVLMFSGAVTANILPATTPLAFGGTLQLIGAGTQTVNGVSTIANTASRIPLSANQSLNLGMLTAIGVDSMLNFNTATGGIAVLTGQTAGNVINNNYTVTDSTGFGLATVNGSNQIVRLTTTALLPATGAVLGTDYFINNNAGGPGADDSSSFTVTNAESASSITVDTTAASGALTLSGGAVLSNNVWNFGGSGINTYTITGGTIQTANIDNTFLINNYNTAPVTFTTPILAFGMNSVVVSGTGITVFNNVNTYTGSTTINGGTINANSTDALGSGDASNILIFNGGTLQAGAIINSPSTRPVTLTSTVIIDTNSNAVSIAGIVSGPGGLTKEGLGSLTLRAANTFTGATAINAGTVTLTAAGTFGAAPNVAIALGTTARIIDLTAALTTLTGTYSGAGTLAFAGTAGPNSALNQYATTATLTGFTGVIDIQGSRLADATQASLGGTTAISATNGG